MKMKDPRVKMLVSAACFALVHAAVYLIFGLSKYSGEGVAASAFVLVVCSVLLALEIALAIFARIKRYKFLLKGLFLYKLVGMVFFVIAWAVSLGSGSTEVGFAATVFNWFSVSTFPVATLLAPLVHLSLFYRKAIVFGIMTIVAGRLVMNIRSNEEFERKMAQKREMEALSEARHKADGLADGTDNR